jgi:hypothetical protein
MKVCEVCGAFLVVGDTQQRVIAHIEGKQHAGFALVRKTLEEYYVCFVLSTSHFLILFPSSLSLTFSVFFVNKCCEILVSSLSYCEMSVVAA